MEVPWFTPPQKKNSFSVIRNFFVLPDISKP